MLHNQSDLSGRKAFRTLLVASHLQLIHQRWTTADPGHEVVHSRTWLAVREVLESEFLFRVGTNLKGFHGQLGLHV